MQINIKIISAHGEQIWGMQLERSSDANEPQLFALLLGSYVQNPRTGVLRKSNGELQIRLRVQDQAVSVHVLTFSSSLKLKLGTTLSTCSHKAAVALFVHADTVSFVVHQQPS
jgi:hypothetical protein